MADRYYIGARYVPAVYEGPDGSNTWLPGVAYDGLVIVTYGNYSYMSKKPVPAGVDPPDVNTAYWIKAAVYNADVNNVVEQLENKADKDGVYPDLFAGNLISDTMQTDNSPYLERETGGGLSGIAPLCYPTLVGASVAENQLCNGESVTVPNGRKYYLKKSGTESIGASTGTAITGLTSGSDMVIDLTQMLGSAIADYAYSLGSNGIAWLRSYGLITDEYKPYNAGTIESVKATAKVVRDENDENAVTYPLGNDVLNGLFKLDASNKLYAYGDTKTSDGMITRKYRLIDLGTLNWVYISQRFRAPLNDASIPAVTNIPNAITAIYLFYPSNTDFSNLSKGAAILTGGGNNLLIRDTSYTDAASFKAAMSGVYLVYETATPTTEQGDPFPSPQVCYPDGTEEYETSNGVPVGHETRYPYNLKGILEQIADVPAANGTYTLKATRSGADIIYTWNQEV